MLGFDGENPAVHPKAKFWHFYVKTCKILPLWNAVKHLHPVTLIKNNFLPEYFREQLFLETSNAALDICFDWNIY